MARTNRPAPRKRINQFAELLSQGLRPCDARDQLELTKGEAARAFMIIKKELGRQAI